MPPPTSGPPSKRQKTTQKKAHNGNSEEGFDEEELERIEAKIRKFMSLGDDVELEFSTDTPVQQYSKSGRKGTAFNIKSTPPAQMPPCPNGVCGPHTSNQWLVGQTKQRYCIINMSTRCTQWMELPYEIGDRCEDSPAQQVICWLQDQAKENKLVKDHLGNVHEYSLPHVPTPLLRNGNPLTIAQWVDTNCDQSILNGKVWWLVGGNSRVRLEVIKELEKDTDTHFPVFHRNPGVYSFKNGILDLTTTIFYHFSQEGLDGVHGDREVITHHHKLIKDAPVGLVPMVHLGGHTLDYDHTLGTDDYRTPLLQSTLVYE